MTVSSCDPQDVAPLRKSIQGFSVSQRAEEAEYAVRGKLVERALEIQKDLLNETGNYPFKEVIFCNIGNPQALRQKPITFYRQVLALCDYPILLENEAAAALAANFPRDAISTAQHLLSCTNGGGTGAYSDSQGAVEIRRMIANGIERRDSNVRADVRSVCATHLQIPKEKVLACPVVQDKVDPRQVFCTDGASSAVHMMMPTMIETSNDAMMIPVPQYPLYSASLTLYGGNQVPYYLNEEAGWQVDKEELERAADEAIRAGRNIKALVVINPGNPTGNVLSIQSQVELIKFCSQRNIAIIADEVYQENIYVDGKEFISFRKVYAEAAPLLGSSIKSFPPCFSLHSASKGFYGECGRRGGYVDVYQPNADMNTLLPMMRKISSIKLCANVTGQMQMALIMNPLMPETHPDSYELFSSERRVILDSLRQRADLLVETFNSLPGISSQPNKAKCIVIFVGISWRREQEEIGLAYHKSLFGTCIFVYEYMVMGAMYVFPRIVLPAGAIEEARKAGIAPDMLYCSQLLEATGIVAVPGSGFHQKPGTFHFRMATLPPMEQLRDAMQAFEKFHLDFLNRY